MKKNVIVSLADSNYFPLLNELIDSIKRFKESSEVAICILDAGLSEDQKTELSSKVDEIKSAEWDIKVPDSKIKGREWLKSQVSRAFLPKYFPNVIKSGLMLSSPCLPPGASLDVITSSKIKTCSFSFEIKRTPLVSSERSKSKISIKILKSN